MLSSSTVASVALNCSVPSTTGFVYHAGTNACCTTLPPQGPEHADCSYSCLSSHQQVAGKHASMVMARLIILLHIYLLDTT